MHCEVGQFYFNFRLCSKGTFTRNEIEPDIPAMISVHCPVL